MARGGARNRSGPRPDPNSLNSAKKGYVLTALPAEGYQGEIPEFPLPDLTAREVEVWRQAWRTPQAAAWSTQPWRWRTVALWVRWSVRMEDPEAGAALLAWALNEAPPRKVLATYDPLAQSLERAGLARRVRRDHRELYLRLPWGGLAVAPDGNYRLARESDIPRLDEYNRLYNEERQTDWSRDWHEAIAARAVYVRERDGVIASCLIRGAIIPPLASFGGTFTFPEFRGRGEATMLVANFCAEMALLGLEVCLLVDDDNAPAVRAYEKVGFVHEGYFRTVYF